MIKLLVAQIFAAGLAAVVFRLGLDPRIAGLIAGSAFIGIGLYGVSAGWMNRSLEVPGYAVLFMALVHLLAVAIPMLGFRILHWDEPFSKVAVWGLSGPDFHQLSTRLYGVWMIFTALAAWRARKRS